MHYSIIINPMACGGRGNSTWSTVKTALDAAQLDYTPLFTRDEEGATYLTMRLADRHAGRPDETLIVIGGDGTLHQVVNGVLQSKTVGNTHCQLATSPAEPVTISPVVTESQPTC